MQALREIERTEWRILGAVRFVDATSGAPIDSGLEVAATGATIRRNRSGLYIVHRWAALAAHEAAFQAPPNTPAVGSVNLRLVVRDPRGFYLPLATTLRLPRNPNPSATVDALFRPETIPLYRSPSAPLGVNWAVVRATVTETRSGDALGGALVRVVSRNQVLARGLTDWRGEALVPVAGVPVTTFSEGPDAVVISEINVLLEAAFDAAAGSRTAPAAVSAGRSPRLLPTVDPIALDSNFNTLPRTRQRELSIAARRSEHIALAIRVR